MKATIVHNNEHTNIIILDLNITPEECREHLKHIHTAVTSQYFSFKKNNQVTYITPYDIRSLEQMLRRHMRTKTATTQSNKSPFLQSYLHTVNPETYTTQCLSHTHDTNRLSNCRQVPTQHNIISPWKKPVEAAEVIQG